METPVKPPFSPPIEREPSFPRTHRGTFYNLQIVMSVAFILATLFTAWTPASLLPGSLTEKLSQALAPLSATTSPAVIPTATARPNPRIGIVAGHWGNDPGAVCPDGLSEGDINLKVATKVQANLKQAGYDVDLLKEFDPLLNGYEATALVSIHADSCEYINDQATGFKVAAALSNPYPERSARLTACLRTRYASATGMNFHATSVTPDMTSYHAFDEISEETTAAIIEIGFLNLDRQILTKERDKVVKGITDGILCFVRNEDVVPKATP